MTKNKKILIAGAAAILLIAIITVAIIILAGKKETYRFIEVDQYNGSVTLERNGTKPELFEGLHLVTNDMVSTGASSDILLLADTDKHILAEENTGFSIEAEGNESKGRIAVNLMYGSSLITIDNKLPDGLEFVVNTPNAALSVRGTVFHVSYDPETETTTVEVTEGVVEVISADGTQNIEAGGSCVVNGNASYETDVTTIAETTLSTTTTEIPAETSRYESQEIVDMLALYLRGEGELNTDMLAEVESLFMTFLNISINVSDDIFQSAEADMEPIISPDLSFLRYCTNIKELYLHGFSVEDIEPISDLITLEQLELNLSGVTDITPLEKLVNLEYLKLQGFKSGIAMVDTTPLKNLTNLTELTIFSCSVNDISSLSNLTKLEQLHIEHTFVSDISSLRGLTNLENLNLGNNEIADVSPLKSLINLESLNLLNNKITDISELKTLKMLKTLIVMNNDVPMSVSDALQQELPNCAIGNDNY